VVNMTSSSHALSGGSPDDREEPHLAVAGRRPGHHGPVRVPRGPYVRVVKPLFDRVVGFCIFLVFLPLTAVVALAVRISLGSPVIFRQPRVGRNDEPFDVYKFRTMGHDRRRAQQPVEPDRRQIHKSTDDPRHTRVGRCLRRWSLDELPQFWNVVRGDMSLVGPRPELVEIVERYEPWQHQRHAVKPGLTGLWQVSSRGTGMMHLHTDIDLEYIETMGFATDLKILFRTIPATLARRGN
jgi:lipopolysaccharide/colanic/teichoic acid biosynthesis glycosyltransferase